MARQTLYQVLCGAQLSDERCYQKQKDGDPKLMAKDGTDLSAAGELAPSAASVLMKIMYAARMARSDLLRPVQALARYMTKWTRQQDLDLHRLVCYIHTTKHWKSI